MATKKTTGLQQVLRALMNKEMVGGRPMSANELASRSGVPQSTISRILTGTSKDVRENVLERLSNYFRITIGQLRGDEPLNLSPFEMVRGSGKSAGRMLVDGTQKSGGELAAPTKDMLTYVDPIEADLLTAYREANTLGKQAIAATAAALSAQHKDPGVKGLPR